MADKKEARRGLGRGLAALMADIQTDGDLSASPTATPGGRLASLSPRRPDQMLPIEKLVPNPDQPRRDFTEPALSELVESIREKGIIQPLIVREVAQKPGMYEIVAGERRWRAAQRAQLHEVPVLVRSFTDSEVLEIAIVENIQRADLNAAEEAMAYRQLMDRFGHTQEKLAEALGKSRSHIANLLRLLTLPQPILGWLRDGSLTAGHARALINTPEPVDMARQVISRKLSVRDTERLAASAQSRPDRPKADAAAKFKTGPKDADTLALEADLAANIGMKVSIEHETGTEGGRITVHYGSLDQLETLCQMLSSGSGRSGF